MSSGQPQARAGGGARIQAQPSDSLIAFDGGTSAAKAVSHIALHGSCCRACEFRLMIGQELIRRGPQQSWRGLAALLRNAGYAVEAKIEPGEADEVIAARSSRDGVDFLVMGAYGHSRIRNLIIGDDHAEMIRSCKIPTCCSDRARERVVPHP